MLFFLPGKQLCDVSLCVPRTAIVFLLFVVILRKYRCHIAASIVDSYRQNEWLLIQIVIKDFP